MSCQASVTNDEMPHAMTNTAKSSAYIVSRPIRSVSAPNISVFDIIENSPLSKLHRKLLMACCGGPFLDGYILSLIGVALVGFSQDITATPIETGFIGAASLLGIFFGAICPYCVYGTSLEKKPATGEIAGKAQKLKSPSLPSYLRRWPLLPCAEQDSRQHDKLQYTGRVARPNRRQADDQCRAPACLHFRT